ncbi:MAG: VrlM [Candidatus Saccharibacteria bacterium GW2011_GWC2_48_9]|nr:MAG: VrlM [Candidatus Saccharibacteria bacterium GW2011_GWC2_48_9]HCH34200.1 hypothetical protein [Candidatus Saccharibacteria bacterium]
MADISSYADRILIEEDKPLFNEAVQSAAVGALRGAYILIWLTCAEALKRKLKEAATRDAAALPMVTAIEAVEASRGSADYFILQKAKDYDLIDDVVLQKLTYIYTMRCVYGHPYETAPSEEELASAANVVSEEVLSRPTLYRKKYLEGFIDKLTGNIDFLENSETRVKAYANDMSVRVDPVAYRYLANVYSSKLEVMYRDPTLAPIVMRGVWFLSEFLKEVGTSFANEDQWHEFVLGCPQISQLIFLRKRALYDAIGSRANDSLVSYALTNASERPTGVKRLEPLLEAGRLSEAQKLTYYALGIAVFKAAHVKTMTAYFELISELKSYNWPRQNIAMSLLSNNDRSQVSDLDEDQQEQLGRNILQAADGSAGSANTYLTALATDYANYPRSFIRGVILESFVNDENKFRLKNAGLEIALPTIANHPELLAELIEKLDAAEPTGWTQTMTFDTAIELINGQNGLSSLATCLERNRVRLVVTSSDEIPF